MFTNSESKLVTLADDYDYAYLALNRITENKTVLKLGFLFYWIIYYCKNHWLTMGATRRHPPRLLQLMSTRISSHKVSSELFIYILYPTSDKLLFAYDVENALLVTTKRLRIQVASLTV